MPALCGAEPLHDTTDDQPVSLSPRAPSPTLSDKNVNIVIAGIGGRYPDCDNIEEFWQKLVAGVELSSIDDRRWPVGESIAFSSS